MTSPSSDSPGGGHLREDEGDDDLGGLWVMLYGGIALVVLLFFLSVVGLWLLMDRLAGPRRRALGD